jgi:hypothetical protein
VRILVDPFSPKEVYYGTFTSESFNDNPIYFLCRILPLGLSASIPDGCLRESHRLSHSALLLGDVFQLGGQTRSNNEER